VVYFLRQNVASKLKHFVFINIFNNIYENQEDRVAQVTMVILANSVKHHQHCVAGKILSSGQWLRPVADENGAELSHEQAKCQNPYGMFSVKPMQKVIIGLEKHVPLANQPENYVIDNSVWKQKYRLNDDDLIKFIETPIDLWGIGDRVPYPEIQTGNVRIDQSLYLVQIENLNLYLNEYERRRASFFYNGIHYDLAVTDPNFDRVISEGHKNILCISLGEVFEGNCYKLVATIF
jgi:hypothetical protein